MASNLKKIVFMFYNNDIGQVWNVGNKLLNSKVWKVLLGVNKLKR